MRWERERACDCAYHNWCDIQFWKHKLCNIFIFQQFEWGSAGGAKSQNIWQRRCGYEKNSEQKEMISLNFPLFWFTHMLYNLAWDMPFALCICIKFASHTFSFRLHVDTIDSFYSKFSSICHIYLWIYLVNVTTLTLPFLKLRLFFCFEWYPNQKQNTLCYCT